MAGRRLAHDSAFRFRLVGTPDRAPTLANQQFIHILDGLCLPGDSPVEIPGSWWWTYSSADDVIAYCGVAPSHQFTDTAYFCRAGVIPAYRGRGIQVKMLKVRERYTFRSGFTWAVTDTACDNYASQTSLVRRQFTPYGPADPWGTRGAIYWRKKLGEWKP